MLVRRHVILAALVVAMVGSASFALPAAASPPGHAPVLLMTKEERKAAKEAEKAAAETRKARKKCDASGVLPCAPTVTLTWVPAGTPGLCYAVVRVDGFAPGDTVDFIVYNSPNDISASIASPTVDGHGFAAFTFYFPKQPDPAQLTYAEEFWSGITSASVPRVC